MTWVRIDDRFPHHRKGIAAGPVGRDLFLCGLAYSNLHRTSGNIPDDAISQLAPGNRRPRETAQRLVEIGLWELTEAGWHIHDYEEWNKTADEIEAIIEKKREAGRIGGIRSGEARRKHRATPSASGSTEAESQHHPRVLPNPSPLLRNKDSASLEAPASTNSHRFDWPEGVDHTLTNWTPNSRVPYEALNHDCPDRRWRGTQCISSTYVAQYPDAMATYHLPAALGPTGTPVPKQCPVHRAQPPTPTVPTEVTPAW